MALETNRPELRPAVRELARQAAALAGPLGAQARSWFRTWVLTPWLIDHIRQSRMHKAVVAFFGASLQRRIFVGNLLGLAILLSGLFYLSQNHAWLIQAKVESLSTQGRIIAEAIAGSSLTESESIVIDPDRLFEPQGARIPYRDDGFTTLELSIRPERVVPLLKRMVDQTASTRARVYARDGTLIADSETLRSRNPAARPDPAAAQPDANGRIRLRNRWTQFLSWLKGGDIEVYRDIGTANGTLYPEVRAALSGSATPMLLVNEQGEQIISFAVPIQRMKTVQGVLLLSTRPGTIEDLLAKERDIILMFAGMALAATLLASWVMARTIAGPMRRLSEAAEHVSHNINARRELPDMSDRRDEVGQMATAFRDMTAALYRRIEASDRFAQDVAHELKNPLAGARSAAETLAYYAKTEEQRQMLAAQIPSELNRLDRLITDIANASRLDADLARQETVPVDMGGVAKQVVHVFDEVLARQKSRQRLELATAGGEANREPFIVRGHKGRLGQVLTNLVDNALSFSPEEGRVLVTMRRVGTEIEIDVDDDGPGIPANALDDIFKRFYSDRPQTDQKTGKNSGLGLSISRDIVVALGGRVWAENRPDALADRDGHAGGREQPELRDRRIPGVAGARFVVRLPAEAAHGR